MASFVLLLPLLLSLAASQDEPEGDEPRPTITRLTVERQWIVRVPVRSRPALRRIEWKESKGFRCIDTNEIRGALLAGPDHVDFLLPNRQRIRASFGGNCPALDFYGTFYLKSDDHQVCARRDFVHSRMGGSCRIERFRRLVPSIKAVKIGD
jgi:hypothetical protein